MTILKSFASNCSTPADGSFTRPYSNPVSPKSLPEYRSLTDLIEAIETVEALPVPDQRGMLLEQIAKCSGVDPESMDKLRQAWQVREVES